MSDSNNNAGRPAVLYMQVTEKLRDDILSGHIKPGDELPSERNLCTQFKVSRITIRKALENLVRSGWIQGIPGKANVVSEFAGSVIPPIKLMMYEDTYDHAMAHGNIRLLERLGGAIFECRRLNLSFSIAPQPKNINVQELLRQRYALIIFERKIWEELESFICENNYPAVACFMADQESKLKTMPIPSLRTNDAPGVVAATEWLVQQGRKKICFIGKENRNLNLLARREAYISVMNKHNLPVNMRFGGTDLSEGILGLDAAQVNYGRQLTEAIIAEGTVPDGIIAINDNYAFGAYEILHRHNIKIHTDCTVIGFDASELAKLTEPPLYSVKKSRHDIGSSAVKLLLESYLTGRKDIEKIIDSVFDPEMYN